MLRIPTVHTDHLKAHMLMRKLVIVSLNVGKTHEIKHGVWHKMKLQAFVLLQDKRTYVCK